MPADKPLYFAYCDSGRRGRWTPHKLYPICKELPRSSAAVSYNDRGLRDYVMFETPYPDNFGGKWTKVTDEKLVNYYHRFGKIPSKRTMKALGITAPE